MKKACLLGMMFFCACICSHAQKIQYSRQTVKKLFTDDVQLVTNIGGNHHLLRFDVNKKPTIFIYNNLLQLEAEEIIDHKLKKNMETKVVAFRNHYFFYIYMAGTSQHALYKVSSDGIVTNLSVPFQQVVDTALNKSKAALQLINQNDRLYVVAHVYYDAIKKINSTVVALDEDIKSARVQKVWFVFDTEEDQLRQTLLSGNNLLVLKTNSNEERGNSLDVMKIELITGKALLKSFNSGSSTYSNTNFRLHPKDSSILVHATLGAARNQRTGFISWLSPSLEEVTPFALLRSQFRNNSDASYFLIEGYSCWLNLSNNYRRVWRTERSWSRENDYPSNYYGAGTPLSSGSALPPNSQAITPHSQGYSFNRNMPLGSTVRALSDYNMQSRVSFTVLDKQLKAVKDSVATANRYEFSIQPQPNAQVTINREPSLFLIQNFNESRRRLLMVTQKREQLVATDINVYDKYEYLLEQLQSLNGNTVILPYIHKNTAGLVKISFD